MSSGQIQDVINRTKATDVTALGTLGVGRAIALALLEIAKQLATANEVKGVITTTTEE